MRSRRQIQIINKYLISNDKENINTINLLIIIANKKIKKGFYKKKISNAGKL